ncbi:hypothetical protein CYMTET_28518 [Cymbomonas tetramitiformis]|uniref:Uncharacterized protein n=1 Tax=Cymbomonas tetramitiformis TaxID=36881 RepID=A0AAE0KVU0_9CHLO|nr:hypothetical protein CYMTET_28518 [Cymbomonas tetramitiformis]
MDLVAAIEATEDLVRWYPGEDGKLYARNWNKSDVRHHLRSCKQSRTADDSIRDIADPMVLDGDVVVDSWSVKTTKLSFPGGSNFALVLTPTPTSHSDNTFGVEDDTPVVEMPGVGPRLEETLLKLGIRTVADLARLDVDTIAKVKRRNYARDGSALEDWTRPSSSKCFADISYVTSRY